MNRSRRSGRRSGSRMRSFEISGSSNFKLVVSNGNTSVAAAVGGNSGPSLVGKLSTAFKFYRYEAVKVVIDPVIRYETTVPSTGQAGVWTMAYIPEEVTASSIALTPGNLKTVPDHVTGMAQIINSNISNNSTLSTGWPGTLMVAGDTVQRTLRVSPRTLRQGLSKMYYCQGSLGAGVTQGFIYFALGDAAGANTVVVTATMHYRVRFFEPEDASTLGLTGGIEHQIRTAIDQKSDQEWFRPGSSGDVDTMQDETSSETRSVAAGGALQIPRAKTALVTVPSQRAMPRKLLSLANPWDGQ